MKHKNIPKGYKDSPLGIIPKEWDIKKIKYFGKVITGNTPSTVDTNNYGDEYMFVSPADLSGNKYITNTEKKLSFKGFLSSRIMPKGTVLFTCIGSTIGKSGIATKELTSNQQINAIICNKSSNNEFLYYELCFKASKIKLIAGEQAVPIINKSDFENIKIVFPPVEEQRKIAEILSVWDEAIEKQIKLIDALIRRKRAMMQQLLTGKKQLPGFTKSWRNVKLEDICIRVIRKNNIGNKKVVTISAQKGFILQTDFFRKSIASDNLDNYYLIKHDEFCYNKSYSNGYPMGVIKRLKGFEKAVVTTLYICFSIKNREHTHIDFLEQYSDAGLLNKELVKIANEGGRAHGLLNVTPDDFFNIKLRIPDFEEQKAIGNILFTADQEIGLVKKRLDQFRTQKRSLMQQLLTGKKRIKI